MGYSAQQALFGYEGYVFNPVFSEDLNGQNDPLNPINSVYDYVSNTVPLNNGFYHEYFQNSFGINRNDTPCSKVMYIAVFQKKDEKKLRSPDIVL